MKENLLYNIIIAIMLLLVIFGVVRYNVAVNNYEQETEVVCYDTVNGVECRVFTQDELLKARL